MNDFLNFKGAKQENTEYKPVDKGEYEVVLTAEWKDKLDKSGKFINCAFRIREDVEQKHQGRLVFDGIYESKTNKGVYQPAKIEGILDTVADANYEFKNYDEVIQYINGLAMRVEVQIEPADPEKPNSKDRNIIKYLSYKPTLHPLAGGGENPFKNIKNADEIDVDSLPF